MPKNYKDKAYYESLYNDIIRTLMIHDKAHNTSVSQYIYNVIKYNDDRLLRPISGINNLVFNANEGVFDGHPFLLMVDDPNIGNVTLKIGDRDAIPMYDSNNNEIDPGNLNSYYIYPIRYDNIHNVFKLIDMDNDTISENNHNSSIGRLLSIPTNETTTVNIDNKELEVLLNEVLNNIFTPYVAPDIMAKYIEEYNKD